MLCWVVPFFKLILGLIVKGYVYSLIASVVIFTVLAILCFTTKPKSKLQYDIKFAMLYFGTIMGVYLLTPIYIWRPFNVINIRITGWVVRKFCYILGVTLELRGADIARSDSGGMVTTNHQSSFDILTQMNLAQHLIRFTAIAKREMIYILPFGPAAWLAGVIFINRRSKTASFDTLDQVGVQIKENKVKTLIYVEGTRNREYGMLPFKKGAFYTAIKHQVPIIPLVYSQYYFIDSKKKIFDNGHVICSMLDPIPTVGMTKENVDELIEKTRTLMLDEYHKICKETRQNKEKYLKESRPRITLVDRYPKKTN